MNKSEKCLTSFTHKLQHGTASLLRTTMATFSLSTQKDEERKKAPNNYDTVIMIWSSCVFIMLIFTCHVLRSLGTIHRSKLFKTQYNFSKRMNNIFSLSLSYTCFFYFISHAWAFYIQSFNALSLYTTMSTLTFLYTFHGTLFFISPAIIICYRTHFSSIVLFGDSKKSQKTYPALSLPSWYYYYRSDKWKNCCLSLKFYSLGNKY